MVIGLALVFDPDLLVAQVELGTVPSWGDFALGIAVGMVAYTGIETISNMAEEARDSARTIRAGPRRRCSRWLGFTLPPAIALSAMPVTEGPGGEFTTELGTPTPTTRCSGSSRISASRAASPVCSRSTSESWLR